MRKESTLQSKEEKIYGLIVEYYKINREWPSIRHLCNQTRLSTKSITDTLRVLRINGYIEQGKNSVITGIKMARTNWLTKSIRVAA
jgi:DNA-binding transcriptional regulator YhcF (GntR family)